MLEVKGLTKSFKGIRVVDDLSFSVGSGEAFALLGANGAGKTTTIMMILGLLPQDKGTIQMPDGLRIGYSPETPYFHSHLTGAEALQFFMNLQHLTIWDLRQSIRDLLKIVGLENDGNTKVRHYSKGMLQRLALAQALLGDPQLLILDEPTAGLDALGRIEMMELISSLVQQGKSVLLNSHILTDIERVCSRGIILKNGVVKREWTLSDGEQLEKTFIEAIGR